MSSLEGRTAIITGGGTGIGRGIALALADRGARVVICGRKPEPLAAARREIEARGGSALDVACDVSDPQARERLVARTLEAYGAINILINNAASIPRASLLETDERAIQQAWETGPLAALMLMRLCHPHLKGDGAIVNVSSGSAIASQAPTHSIYAGVKAALNAFSRAAANEWAADGIRVNTIMPVARSEAFARWEEAEPVMAAAVARSIPLGRVGDCETDIGRAVAFLVGPDAGYITGAIIPLDGGSAYVR
jgi:meso-butanediol dehydrogenase/(S,S)-butanediol dehydrogenase/diacetyl reductase